MSDKKNEVGWGTVRSSGLGIVSGNSNPEFAEGVARNLNMSPMSANVTKFANGEINIAIDDPVRGDDVFVCQSTCANPSKELNVNESVMELLLLIHTV